MTADRDGDPEMDEQELRAEVRRLAPFYHDIELPHGVRTHVPELAALPKLERTRWKAFMDHAWGAIVEAAGGSLAGQRVLDCGCNCGGFSIAAARAGAAQVLGVDLVPKYLEQARFLKRALAIENLQFEQWAVEDLDPVKHGQFDVTLCLGLLYHFENPILAMKKLAAMTRKVLVVDTRIQLNPLVRAPAWKSEVYAPAVEKFEACGKHRTAPTIQFVPNAAAVTQLLEFLGFSRVIRLRSRRTLRPFYWLTAMTFIGVR
jgi:2-polyprenyl-3-methyl-5-hydroxy-6-metoxy-1,4-benzoquinol methylase